MNLVKYIRFTAFLSVFTLSLFGCDKKKDDLNNHQYVSQDSVNQKGEYNKKLTESDIPGIFINGVEVYASSYLYNQNNLINCSGMSGSESYLHLHTSNEPRSNMFLTQANQKENYVILKLPSITQIGRMYIWNYNNFAKIDCALKTFSVSFSSDGHTFTPFDDSIYSLDRNDGRSDISFNKINDKDYLDLKGISAKYLKIDFLSNYGGSNYGLSEIRLYQYKSVAKQGNEVNLNVFPTKNTSINNICNGSGISEINSLEAKSSNNPYFMYKSQKKEVTFTLNGNYPIEKIGIWNYNDPEKLSCGIKELEIYSSINGKTFDLVGKYQIAKASGKDDETVSTIISLGNLSCQYLRFKYLSNYGGEEYGLSEVKVIMGKGRVSELDIEHTGLFSSYRGWTGADGIFAVRANGDQSIGGQGKAIFNFSDTYIGEVDPISKLRKNSIFKNNSFGYFDNKMEFVTDSPVISPEKMLDRSSSDAFNWLGDSFIIGDKYYVTSLYMAKEGVLGFSQRGEDLVRFDIKDGKIDFDSKVNIIDQDTNKLSYFSKDGSLSIIFGSAYFENTESAKSISPDGYIYNFGYRDDKNSSYSRGLVCSRFKESDVEDFSKYQYLSNDGWVNDITKTKVLCDRVSCEMSVTEINDENSPYYGNFILTYQKDTVGNEICVSVTSSFEEGFNSSMTIYSTLETLIGEGLSQYNAKMHPVLSSKNKYVISYNLNEGGGSNLNASDGDIYHPRFITLFEI